MRPRRQGEEDSGPKVRGLIRVETGGVVSREDRLKESPKIGRLKWGEHAERVTAREMSERETKREVRRGREKSQR